MRFVLWIIITLIVLGCSGEDDFTIEESPQFVVEGWIENGGFPVVMITKTFSVSTNNQSLSNFDDYILKWATVKITDGVDTVVLTGKYDRGYFPPYIYTTGRMRGESGKRYTLIVEYRDFFATATTFIPASPESCMFRVGRCEESDSLYQITAIFTDKSMEKNYYQLFTRVGTLTKQYQASYLGSINDVTLNGLTEVPVYRGHQFSQENYSPYFSINDTVSVKFSQIDETSFRIWDSYTKTLSLSKNMFLSISSDIVSNINGGFGYWCGYGALTKHIIIRDSL